MDEIKKLKVECYDIIERLNELQAEAQAIQQILSQKRQRILELQREKAHDQAR